MGFHDMPMLFKNYSDTVRQGMLQSWEKGLACGIGSGLGQVPATPRARWEDFPVLSPGCVLQCWFSHCSQLNFFFFLHWYTELRFIDRVAHHCHFYHTEYWRLKTQKHLVLKTWQIAETSLERALWTLWVQRTDPNGALLHCICL